MFRGQPVENLTVPKARALGVETVYQERALADLQTLWRNIFLGRELSNRLGVLQVKRMKDETQRLMVDQMGYTSSAVNPDSVIKTFSGGEKQGWRSRRRSLSHRAGHRRADDGPVAPGRASC